MVREGGLFFDFDKLMRTNGVTSGGEFPRHWNAMRVTPERRNLKEIELPPELPELLLQIVWVDDGDAMAEAISQSLEMMPPSLQIKTAIGVKARTITNIPRLLDGARMSCAARLRCCCSRI